MFCQVFHIFSSFLIYFKKHTTKLNSRNTIFNYCSLTMAYNVISVATKYSKKYLVRVLLNCFEKVFSTSTLRGVIQKYLVRVLNIL